ncbi:MAG: carbon storage regulator CsrA [Cellulosilyticaceae bacterium]
MLALTRKKDESIIIDGKIKIQVLDIIDGKVRIGIDAPKEMTIHREEIYIDIITNNKGAVSGNKDVSHMLAELIKENK